MCRGPFVVLVGQRAATRAVVGAGDPGRGGPDR